MIFGLTSFDGALHWDGGKPTLILLIPRDRDSAPRWIETDGFFQFHFANGYEDDGALVLDLTRYPDYETIGGALRTFHDSEWPADGMAALTRLRVDLATGQVQTRAFPTGNANEFPRMDPRRVAHRYRFAYIASNPPGEEIGLQQRLTRVDMDTGETISHDFGPGRYPGEPVFIPAPGSPEEDDGVVVTLVYDAARGLSEIVGIDARDLAAKPLFAARLRHPVPFGLHGYFRPAPTGR
jgi:all-trans-8'-apo-beta-carotenal 15,15'-oxygenase